MPENNFKINIKIIKKKFLSSVSKIIFELSSQ